MVTLLKGGTIVLETHCLKGDILLADGKIAAIAESITERAARVIDCTGQYILPGFIDPHTHMDLQQSIQYRAADDFYSGTRAAALGGTTTIIDHISFSPPGSPLRTSIERYHQLAKNAVIDYSFHGVIQHVDEAILAELKALVGEGVQSFKAYSTYGYAVNDRDFLRLLAALKEVDGLLTVHCENDGLIEYCNQLLASQHNLKPSAYARSRPILAEVETVSRLLQWAKALQNAPLYIVHCSAGQSVEAVVRARQGGQENIFVETCPQYLLFTEQVYLQDPARAAQFIMAPPLRTARDQTRLWSGLFDGDIQVVATDHCPFTKAEKHQGIDDYRSAPGGVAGVQERGLVMYNEAVVKRQMDLRQFADIMSTNAAKIFNCYPQKGVIAVDSDADLVLINPRGETHLTQATLYSRADYSPYAGYRAAAEISHVFSKGKVIVENGQFKGRRGDGRWLARRSPQNC